MAFGLLDQAVESGKPLFLRTASVAPHSNVELQVSKFGNDAEGVGKRVQFTVLIIAKRHEHLFKEVKVPRTLSFNPKTHQEQLGRAEYNASQIKTLSSYQLDAEGPQFEREGLVYRQGAPWYERV
ncbi:uncharacterized protein V1516DRAFT_666162 [Lipomyces oligophaga]|uniref:uncharacterized protein n=1 Tax=Lipomyces oligophaga TaxID=45792 RepID=UPI0034CD9CA9